LSIEKKEPTLDLIKRFAPSSKIEDFSKQRITCYASNVKPSDTLKEIMHNGAGLPYIPGSSIKGAVRTAIVASLINKMTKPRLPKKSFKPEGQKMEKFQEQTGLGIKWYLQII
jgi:CRISPR type III-A-associated RAMP protein Csm5